MYYVTRTNRPQERGGINNENNKNKNSLKSKMKDFIFSSTMVKADS